jgi:hypothetical protein
LTAAWPSYADDDDVDEFSYDLTFEDPEAFDEDDMDVEFELPESAESSTSSALYIGDDDAQTALLFETMVAEARPEDGMLVPVFDDERLLGHMVVSKRATAREALQEAVEFAKPLVFAGTRTQHVRPAGLENWDPAAQPELGNKPYALLLLQMGYGDLFHAL